MLLKNNRLSLQKDFLVIKKRGKSFYNQFFKLKYIANQSEASRFSVIISAKISKKAVIRNRLRRQCLEIIRLNINQIKTGYNILIWPNNQTIGLDYQILEKNLLILLKKSTLLK